MKSYIKHAKRQAAAKTKKYGPQKKRNLKEKKRIGPKSWNLCAKWYAYFMCACLLILDKSTEKQTYNINFD